ncbi:MAG: hypothetical protein P4M15_10005 [Alphaproteobacteria bacterium]|nr:hypothetical protein [Alphaproteobacteria bacterium]
MRILAPDWRIAIAGLFGFALIPLLATPVLPLIDFYNHLARFFVLSHIGSNSAFQTYYATHWALQPDIGLDFLAVPVLAVVPPLIAAHVITIVILATLYGGVLYLNRVLTSQKSVLVAVLLLPLLYSYILNWGFANFLLGLGLAFWAAGWWLQNRHHPRLAVPISCLFSIVIFFTHGLAFALYGVLVGSLEIGYFVNAPTRRLSDLLQSLFFLAAQAVIPLLFLFFWISSMAPASPDAIAAAARFSQAAAAMRGDLPGRILKRLVPILRVEEGPTYWFDVATFVVQGVAMVFLMRCGRIAIARKAWPLIAAAVLTVMIGAPVLFGVGYITDRMPLFAALVLLSTLCIRPGRWNNPSRVAGAILVAVVFLRLVAVAVDWHAYASEYREYQILAAKIPPGSLTIGVPLGGGYHRTGNPRCEMYGPLLVAQYDQGGPLFAQSDQHPLLTRGRLKTAVEALYRSFPLEGIDDGSGYISAAASAGFDFQLVCNTQLLSQPLPSNVNLMARTAHFALLRAAR